MSTELGLQDPALPQATIPYRRSLSSRAVSWLQARPVDVWIVFGIVVVAAVVHAVGMSTFPARFDDEGAYMSQAWAVIDRFDLSHYTYWYDHPPLGWLILAGYSAVTGALARAPYGVAAGRELMLVMQVISVVLLYVLARRLEIRRAFAALAGLIFALSPLGLFFHRMVLLDNLAMPLLLGGFVLALSPRRKLGAHVFAAGLLALAVLVRETFILFVPFAIFLYWRSTDRRTRGYSTALTATTFFGLVLLYPIFALLRGELFPGEGHVSLLGAIGWQLFDRSGSGSILDPSSPAGQVLSSWLTLDPWILVLGTLSALVLLAVPRLRWVGVIVVLLGAMLLRPGYLPVMYVVSALPFLALAIAGVLDEGWGSAGESGDRSPGSWARRGVVVVGVVALCLILGNAYRPGIARASSFDADAPFRQASAWLSANLKPDEEVFLDGALWLDVVQQGHPPGKAIWFYKLDSDPGVEVPGGWGSVEYIVSSEVVRASLYDLPNVEQALENSEVIEVFGEGDGRVEIREITAP